MEGIEYGTQSNQLGRYFCGVHGTGDVAKIEAMLRGNIAKRSQIWKLVCESEFNVVRFRTAPPRAP
jgi:hypothetical protein